MLSSVITLSIKYWDILWNLNQMTLWKTPMAFWKHISIHVLCRCSQVVKIYKYICKFFKYTHFFRTLEVIDSPSESPWFIWCEKWLGPKTFSNQIHSFMSNPTPKLVLCGHRGGWFCHHLDISLCNSKEEWGYSINLGPGKSSKIIKIMRTCHSMFYPAFDKDIILYRKIFLSTIKLPDVWW